jgi:bleomycin hydrolase
MRAPALAALIAVLPASSQEPVTFHPERDPMYESIERTLGRVPEPPGKSRMWVDFTKVDAPKTPSEFTTLWHTPPARQGLSDMCWCFSTTSFLESEIHRLTGREIRLSSLFTVYWEHVEKARNFVRLKGKVDQKGNGSESDAVLAIWRKYGTVPAGDYLGLTGGRTEHGQAMDLYPELKACLQEVQARGAWDEEAVVAKVRAILDRRLGRPPDSVTVDGAALTPREYLARVVRLNPDDYVQFLSCLDHPAWTRTEYEVPDNWRHTRDYLNLPLDVFMKAFKEALKAGFTVSIAADMSEPGYAIEAPGIAIVPAWDIPPAAIDARARQFRFDNGTTTDDHGLHVVGWTRHGGQDWFLVKDSWSSAWNNAHPGYYFYREDYVKLKVLSFMVHKDAVKDVLAREKR